MIVRSAIIGGGMIAAVHRRAVLNAGGELAGVLGSHPERTRKLADAWRVRAFTDVDELLLDPDIDVVHVCSPNATHASYTRAALHVGKNVICEKPIATSV